MNVSPARLERVFRDSLEMLIERPALFAPKILSAAVSSVWLLAFVEGLGSTAFFLVTMPFVVFLGVSVSVMVADMVYENSSFSEALFSVLQQFLEVLKATLILLVIFTIVSLPLSLGFGFYLAKGVVAPLVAGFTVTIVAVIALTFLLYFFPVALVESGTVKEGFRKSGWKSISNYGEVSILTLVSFLLFVVAIFSQGRIESLGYLGFMTGRVISSIVTTYFFVVSPTYYDSTP